MRSTRVWTAVALAAIAALGAVACGGGGDEGAAPASSAGQASTTSPAPTADSSSMPPAPAQAPAGPAEGGDAAGAGGIQAPSGAATLSAEELAALVEALSSPVQQATQTEPGAPPPTKEQIEADVRENLRELGIPL